VLLLCVTLAAIGWLGSTRSGRGRRAGEPLVQPHPLWEMEVAHGATAVLTPGGLVLLREGDRLRVIDAGGRDLLEATLPVDNLVLPVSAAEADRSLLIFEVIRLPAGEHPYGESVRIRAGLGGPVQNYDLPGGALLVAAASRDGQRMALGVMNFDGDRPEGHVHVLHPDRGQKVAHRLAAGALFRLELCPAGSYLVAADRDTAYYLHGESGLLVGSWRYGEGVRDVGLLPRGGPVVLTASALQVYDERGGLAWRRPLRSPGVTLKVGLELIVVVTRDSLEVYGENGRRVGRWLPRRPLRDVDLSADGERMLVVYDDRRMVMYRFARPTVSGGGS